LNEDFLFTGEQAKIFAHLYDTEATSLILIEISKKELKNQ